MLTFQNSNNLLDLFCSLVLEVRNVDNSCNRTVKFLHISDKYNTLRQKKTGSIKHVVQQVEGHIFIILNTVLLGNLSFLQKKNFVLYFIKLQNYRVNKTTQSSVSFLAMNPHSQRISFQTALAICLQNFTLELFELVQKSRD